MLKEIYDYIEVLPKTFEEVFKSDTPVCVISLFDALWYFDVSSVDADIDYGYIKAVKINGHYYEDKAQLKYILGRCQPIVVQYLNDIARQLKYSYVIHQVQYLPFIFGQIDENEGRTYWRVFSVLGFKNVKDTDFQRIISNPVLFKWVTTNINRDTEDEYEKLKTLQFFINPQMYGDVYKAKELSEELKHRVDVIRQQIQNKTRMK